MKIKIAALMSICVFLVGIAGMGSVSATDSVTSSTSFTNVDLKHGEALNIPGGQVMEVKGIQDGKIVAMKVKWHDICFNKSYLVHVSLSYTDLFNDTNMADDYLYFDKDSKSNMVSTIIFVPYMNIDTNNTLTVEILPDDYYC